MSSMEQKELATQRQQIEHDVEHLVGKYRSIFGWDIPDIDQTAADRLILSGLRGALDALEQRLVWPEPR